MNFRASSGHRLQATAYIVSETYGGLLEGRPTKALNRSFIKGLAREASSAWGDRPTHIIDPPMVKDDRGGEWMPAWCICAWLTGPPPEANAMGGQLVLMWFVNAEDLASKPLLELTKRATKGLDWRGLSGPYDI